MLNYLSNTTLERKSLNDELATLEKALVAYWGYFQRAETIYRDLAQRYPLQLLQAVGLAWQYERQAKNSKNYQVQRHLRNEAQFCLDFAYGLDPAVFTEMKADVFDRFDANLRS